MNARDAKHHIATMRRHYGLQGEDILACYETAIAAIYPRYGMPYVTVSVNKPHWDKIRAMLPEEAVVKHPGVNVECLLLFGNVYVRKQARVSDEDIVWSKEFGCYVPGTRFLYNQFQAMITNSSSTKKVIAYGEHLAEDLHRWINLSKDSI